MKVLHINTFDKGGAFLAAYRLHSGLLQEGVTSNFMVLHKLTLTFEVVAFLEGRGFFYKVLDSLRYRYYTFRKNRLKKKLPDPLITISLPRGPYDITTHPMYKESDVVHLHWVSDFLDLFLFFKKNKKPVIWTLHDSNPFSGIFHYPVEINSSSLQGIDRSCQAKKKEMFRKKCPYFITPSRWMLSRLISAMPFSTPYAEVINNGIEGAVDHTTRRLTRHRLQISEEDCVLVFVAENAADPIKGIALLLKAVEILPEKGNIVLLIIGNLDTTIEGIRTISSGYINQPSSYYAYLSAGDIFMAPYLMDNFPNTLLEAMVTGLPMIGFMAGGVPEIIDDRVNGLLAEASNASDLSDKIQLLIANPMLRLKMSQAALEGIKKFSIENQAKRYIEVYNNQIVSSKEIHA
jgi:glycosyltransferase involved in cell wall biosynthesis